MRVFFSSPWIPIEWIKAHGHGPQGIWSIAPDTTPALPEGMCAFACSMMTAATARGDAAFVFTTACDQMRRAADAVIGTGGPHTFLFNLPSTWQSETARALYHAEFVRLGGFLERLGGQRPTDDRLLDVMRESDVQRQMLRSMLTRKCTREVVGALAQYYSGLPVEDPTPTRRAVRTSVSLALVGGPLSAAQWSLLEAIESSGGQVVLNAIEPGERTLPPALRDDLSSADPRTSLANHYFDHIVDVFQRPNSRLYSWLGPRLSARHVRGILLWVHVGCDLWRAEAETLRQAFSLPLLVLESHDMQGIAVREAHRLQAFIESLR